jgi:hypothetical protein
MLTHGLPSNFGEKLFCGIFTFLVKPLPHEHIVKNGRFQIRKPPVSSSNFYENMTNDLILMKFGTNVDWTISSVTACSILNFLLPWQRGDATKLTKSLFCIVFFFHQN